MRSLIQAGKITACHDVSDGGLLVAIAEMTYRNGMGANITATGDARFWFGEDQARYIISSANGAAILEAAKKANITAILLGNTQVSQLTVDNITIRTSELKVANEKWLPEYMA